MITGDFKFKALDDIEIHCFYWLPEQPEKARAIVQIAHGMAEHSLRYGRFAEKLVAKGFAVYANDHRGHGKTAGEAANLGFFAPANGWNLVVADMHELTKWIKKKHTGLPVFIFGHSMGSLLARQYIISHFEEDISGCILSATGPDPGLLGKIGYMIASLECRIKGNRHPSKLLMHLSFGSFNKEFKPARTEFDWLSRDKAEVDKYIADPFCGGIFTAGFFKDLLYGIGEINKESNIEKMAKNLPIHFLSGARDPMGKSTGGVKEVIGTFQKAGIRNITSKFYPEARHELLNETNREEVYQDLIRWLEEHIKK